MARVPDLATDLRVVRDWVAVNHECSLIQFGISKKPDHDCIQRKQAPKCDRCLILVRLDRQISKIGAEEKQACP